MKKFLPIIFTLAFAFPAAAQDAVTVITNAALKASDYRIAFTDLLADERKTFETFDKNGNSAEKTTVLSSLLVYRSGRDQKMSNEMRNVREVNGKPIPDSQKRVEEFLAELDKQQTTEAELKKLERESVRYDRSVSAYGLTLNQAVALAPNLIKSFDFKFMPDQKIGDAQCYVVDYQQKAPNPYITVNERPKKPDAISVNYVIDIPGALKKEQRIVRGTLWIDRATFQIRRERRQLIIRPSDPVVLVDSLFEYSTSDFGILVPTTINLEFMRVFKEPTNAFTATRANLLRLEYSNFRRTNVDVKILDDEQ